MEARYPSCRQLFNANKIFVIRSGCKLQFAHSHSVTGFQISLSFPDCEFSLKNENSLVNFALMLLKGGGRGAALFVLY